MRDMWKIAIPSMLLLFTASACGEADQGAPEAPAVEESAPSDGAMEGMMEDAGDAVEGAMDDAGDAMEGAMDDASDAMEDAMEDAGDAMEDAGDDAKDAMDGMSLPE